MASGRAGRPPAPRAAPATLTCCGTHPSPGPKSRRRATPSGRGLSLRILGHGCYEKELDAKNNGGPSANTSLTQGTLSGSPTLAPTRMGRTAPEGSCLPWPPAGTLRGGGACRHSALSISLAVAKDCHLRRRGGREPAGVPWERRAPMSSQSQPVTLKVMASVRGPPPRLPLL